MHYSFIVRIYRHEKNNPRMLVGTVEKVGKEGRSAFTNVDELWQIINEGTDLGRIAVSFERESGNRNEDKM